MAKPFNLTAQLNVTGPVGLKPVVGSIKKQLSGITTNVNVKIDSKASRGVKNLNRDILKLNKALRTAASQASSLSASMGKLGSSLRTIQSSSAKSAKGLSSVGKSAQQTGKELAVAKTEMEEFGRISGLALRRYAGFTVATTLTFGFVRAVSTAVGEALKFERELIKIGQVTGKTMGGLKGLTDEVGRLASKWGVASSELLEVSRILAQTGLNAREVKTALGALAKSSLAPTFKDMKSTAEGVIAAMSQFGLKAKDLDAVLGSLNAVAGKFAVESGDLISVIRRTGGVFKAAAGDIGAPKKQLNELIAIFTSVRATTRESAESIATGLRTIFTRIQRPRSIQFLKELGVTVQDLSGKFVGPYEALNRLSKALKSLDPRDVRFAKIVEELGGFRQVGKLIPAIQQFGKAQSALKVAMAGQDSLARDAAEAQKSLLVQAVKVREEFNKLFRTVAQSTSFRVVAKSVLQLSSSLIKLAESVAPVLPFLTLIGGIKGAGMARAFGSGFLGGVGRAGGAGAVGQGMAGAVTGQAGQVQGKSAVASQALATTQKAQTTATLANTKALLALSTAVYRLVNRPMGQMGGGRRGFASGGLVPGTGNYDSVPANLTPGEFVIRKSSVKQLGLGNLHSANKMASGGRVSKSRTAYGARKPMDAWNSTHANVASWVQDTDVTKSKLQGMGTKSAQWQAYAAEAETAWMASKGKIDSAAAKKAKKQAEKTGVSSAIRDGVLRIGKEGNPVVGMLSVRPEKGGSDIQSKTYSYNPTGGDEPIIRVLQAAGHAGNTAQVKKIKGKGGIKIPMSVGYIDAGKRQEFDSVSKESISTAIGNVMDIYALSKGKLKGKGKTGRAIGKTMRQIGIKDIQGKVFEAAISGLTGIYGKDDKARFDFNVAGAADIQKERLQQLFGENTGVTERFLDAKMTASNTNISSMKEKTTAATVLPHLKDQITAFAKGGSVDSVPAMLTPGEFVINKGAASSIGLGNLVKMNQGQMPAFHSGGFVGRARDRISGFGTGMKERMGQAGAGQIGMGMMFAGPMAQQAIGTGSAGASGIGGALGGAAMAGGTAGMLGLGPWGVGITAATGALSGLTSGIADFTTNLNADAIKLASEKLEKAFDNLRSGAKHGTDQYARASKAAAKAAKDSMDHAQGFGQVAKRLEGFGMVTTPLLELFSLGREGQKGDMRTLHAETGFLGLAARMFNSSEENAKNLEKVYMQVGSRHAEQNQASGQVALEAFAERFQKADISTLGGGRARARTDKLSEVERTDLINIMNADAEASARLAKIRASGLPDTEKKAQREQVLLDVYTQTVAPLEKRIKSERELDGIARRATKAFDMMNNRFAASIQMINRIVAAMDNWEQRLSSNVRAAQGAPTISSPQNALTNIVQNPQAFSMRDSRNTMRNMDRQVGGTSQFREAALVRQFGLQLERSLPSILSKAEGMEVGAQTQFVEDAVRSMGGTGGGTQQKFFSDMADVLKRELSTQGGRQGNITMRSLGEDPSQIKKIKGAGEAFERAQKTVLAYAKALDKAAAIADKLANQHVQLMLAAREAQRDVARIGFEKIAAFAQVAGRELTVKEQMAPFDAETRSLSGKGVFGTTTTDPHQLAQRRQAMEAERRAIQDRRNAIRQRGGEVPKSLNNRYKLLTGSIRENHMALKRLATDTSRVSAIMNKLAKIQEKRTKSRDILKGMLTASPEELAETRRGQGIVGGVMRGGNISQLSPQDRALFFKTLQQMKEIAQVSGDTKQGQEILRKLDKLEADAIKKAFGGGAGGKGGNFMIRNLLRYAGSTRGGTSIEKALGTKLKKVFGEKSDSAKALAGLAGDIAREFGTESAIQYILMKKAFQDGFGAINSKGFTIKSLPTPVAIVWSGVAGGGVGGGVGGGGVGGGGGAGGGGAGGGGAGGGGAGGGGAGAGGGGAGGGGAGGGGVGGGGAGGKFGAPPAGFKMDAFADERWAPSPLSKRFGNEWAQRGNAMVADMGMPWVKAAGKRVGSRKIVDIWNKMLNMESRERMSEKVLKIAKDEKPPWVKDTKERKNMITRYEQWKAVGEKHWLMANRGTVVPGTGSSDTVPAMLTPGEFVVNASASQANLGLLHDINTHGATQRFNSGGEVGPGRVQRFAGFFRNRKVKPKKSSRVSYRDGLRGGAMESIKPKTTSDAPDVEVKLKKLHEVDPKKPLPVDTTRSEAEVRRAAFGSERKTLTQLAEQGGSTTTQEAKFETLVKRGEGQSDVKVRTPARQEIGGKGDAPGSTRGAVSRSQRVIASQAEMAEEINRAKVQIEQHKRVGGKKRTLKNLQAELRTLELDYNARYGKATVPSEQGGARAGTEGRGALTPEETRAGRRAAAKTPDKPQPKPAVKPAETPDKPVTVTRERITVDPTSPEQPKPLTRAQIKQQDLPAVKKLTPTPAGGRVPPGSSDTPLGKRLPGSAAAGQHGTGLRAAHAKPGPRPNWPAHIKPGGRTEFAMDDEWSDRYDIGDARSRNQAELDRQVSEGIEKQKSIEDTKYKQRVVQKQADIDKLGKTTGSRMGSSGVYDLGSLDMPKVDYKGIGIGSDINTGKYIDGLESTKSLRAKYDDVLNRLVDKRASLKDPTMGRIPTEDLARVQEQMDFLVRQERHVAAQLSLGTARDKLVAAYGGGTTAPNKTTGRVTGKTLRSPGAMLKTLKDLQGQRHVLEAAGDGEGAAAIRERMEGVKKSLKNHPANAVMRQGQQLDAVLGSAEMPGADPVARSKYLGDLAENRAKLNNLVDSEVKKTKVNPAKVEAKIISDANRGVKPQEGLHLVEEGKPGRGVLGQQGKASIGEMEADLDRIAKKTTPTTMGRTEQYAKQVFAEAKQGAADFKAKLARQKEFSKIIKKAGPKESIHTKTQLARDRMNNALGAGDTSMRGKVLDAMESTRFENAKALATKNDALRRIFAIENSGSYPRSHPVYQGLLEEYRVASGNLDSTRMHLTQDLNHSGAKFFGQGYGAGADLSTGLTKRTNWLPDQDPTKIKTGYTRGRGGMKVAEEAAEHGGGAYAKLRRSQMAAKKASLGALTAKHGKLKGAAIKGGRVVAKGGKLAGGAKLLQGAAVAADLYMAYEAIRSGDKKYQAYAAGRIGADIATSGGYSLMDLSATGVMWLQKKLRPDLDDGRFEHHGEYDNIVGIFNQSWKAWNISRDANDMAQSKNIVELAAQQIAESRGYKPEKTSMVQDEVRRTNWANVLTGRKQGTGGDNARRAHIADLQRQVKETKGVATGETAQKKAHINRLNEKINAAQQEAGIGFDDPNKFFEQYLRMSVGGSGLEELGKSLPSTYGIRTDQLAETWDQSNGWAGEWQYKSEVYKALQSQVKGISLAGPDQSKTWRNRALGFSGISGRHGTGYTGTDIAKVNDKFHAISVRWDAQKRGREYIALQKEKTKATHQQELSRRQDVADEQAKDYGLLPGDPKAQSIGSMARISQGLYDYVSSGGKGGPHALLHGTNQPLKRSDVLAYSSAYPNDDIRGSERAIHPFQSFYGPEGLFPFPLQELAYGDEITKEMQELLGPYYAGAGKLTFAPQAADFGAKEGAINKEDLGSMLRTANKKMGTAYVGIHGPTQGARALHAALESALGLDVKRETERYELGEKFLGTQGQNTFKTGMDALASKFGLWGSAGTMEALGKDIIPAGRWAYGFPNFDADIHAGEHLSRDNLEATLQGGSSFKDTLDSIIKDMNQPTWADKVKIGFPPLSQVQAMMAGGDKNYQDTDSFGYRPSQFGHRSWGALGTSAWTNPVGYDDSFSQRSSQFAENYEPVKKNAGGRIPGTGTSDTVPAMLTPGEFVVNAAASQANLGLLQSINTHGSAQRFAMGGQAAYKVNGLWVAPIGSKLTPAQIKENRFNRGRKRPKTEAEKKALRKENQDRLERIRGRRQRAEQGVLGKNALDIARDRRTPAQTARRSAAITKRSAQTGRIEGRNLEADRAAQKRKKEFETPAQGEVISADLKLRAQQLLGYLQDTPIPKQISLSDVAATSVEQARKLQENNFLSGPAVSTWAKTNKEVVDLTSKYNEASLAEKATEAKTNYFENLEKAYYKGVKRQLQINLDRQHPGTEQEPDLPHIKRTSRTGTQNTLQQMRGRSRTHGSYSTRYSTGGAVDTVPAMLTPGEFVVNASAAQRNLGLLHSINDGPVQKFAKGGPVRRYRDGGREGRGGLFGGNRELATALTAFNITAPSIAAAMNNFASSELAAAMNSLAGSSQKLYDAAVKLADALSRMPHIPEQISGAFAASVNLSNEAGFGETLAKAIGRDLGDTISGEVSKHTQKRNVDGTPAGPVT